MTKEYGSVREFYDEWIAGVDIASMEAGVRAVVRLDGEKKVVEMKITDVSIIRPPVVPSHPILLIDPAAVSDTLTVKVED